MTRFVAWYPTVSLIPRFTCNPTGWTPMSSAVPSHDAECGNAHFLRGLSWAPMSGSLADRFLLLRMFTIISIYPHKRDFWVTGHTYTQFDSVLPACSEEWLSPSPRPSAVRHCSPASPEGLDSRLTLPKFEPQLWHLVTLGPWESYLNSLCLLYLARKMRSWIM